MLKSTYIHTDWNERKLLKKTVLCTTCSFIHFGYMCMVHSKFFAICRVTFFTQPFLVHLQKPTTSDVKWQIHGLFTKKKKNRKKCESLMVLFSSYDNYRTEWWNILCDFVVNILCIFLVFIMRNIYHNQKHKTHYWKMLSV